MANLLDRTTPHLWLIVSVGRNSKAYSAERKHSHAAHYVSLMRSPIKTFEDKLYKTLQHMPCSPHGYCLAGLHWNALARVGRNSKAYSAERKDIHTAHYVSLIRPCTTTQSILKQLRPATARVVPAEYTS